MGFDFTTHVQKIKRNLEFRGQPKNPSYNNITVQLHVQMIVQTSEVVQMRMRILVCCMFPQILSTRGRACVVLKIYVFIWTKQASSDKSVERQVRRGRRKWKTNTKSVKKQNPRKHTKREARVFGKATDDTKRKWTKQNFIRVYKSMNRTSSKTLLYRYYM